MKYCIFIDTFESYSAFFSTNVVLTTFVSIIVKIEKDKDKKPKGDDKVDEDPEHFGGQMAENGRRKKYNLKGSMIPELSKDIGESIRWKMGNSDFKS